MKFVETIGEADVSGVKESKALRNVMRADENAIEPGTYTDTLLKAAPSREGNRVSVKQVISRKK